MREIVGEHGVLPKMINLDLREEREIRNALDGKLY